MPIRNFGIYSAIGVLATLILLLSFLPAALELWPPRRPDAAAAKATARRHQPTTFEKGVERAFEILGGFIIRRWGLVTLGCVLVICGCSLGLFRMQTSVHLIKFFDRHAKIIRDYTWLETHLAKLVPMELVVRVRPELLRATKPAGEAGEEPDRPPHPNADSRERMQLNFLEQLHCADHGTMNKLSFGVLTLLFVWSGVVRASEYDSRQSGVFASSSATSVVLTPQGVQQQGSANPRTALLNEEAGAPTWTPGRSWLLWLVTGIVCNAMQSGCARMTQPPMPLTPPGGEAWRLKGCTAPNTCPAWMYPPP